MSSAQPYAPAPAPRRRRSGRWVWWLVGIVVVVVALVVVADVATRAYAESAVKSQIQDQLPSSVQGDVDVSIGGFSFLSQLASGAISQVDLDAPAVTVDGVPLDAHITATDVPLDRTKPIGAIDATLTLSQNAVNQVISLPGGAQLVLGDGVVSYDGTANVLGLQVGYTVTGTVQAQGTDVIIQPQKAALKQGGSTLDVSGLLNTVAKNPITVCVADRLPKGAQMKSLVVTPQTMTASATLTDVVVDENTLSDLGSCS
jgi:Tfp pilus assembly major pilin PilA